MSRPFQFFPAALLAQLVFLAFFAALLSALRVQELLPVGFRSKSSFHFPSNHLIHITPNPFLSRLNRAHHGMMDMMKMLGGMLVLRRIATPHFAAHHTHAQVNPIVANLDAILAHVHIGRGDFNLIQMLAFTRHGSSPCSLILESPVILKSQVILSED
jgi:hypothetical protein